MIFSAFRRALRALGPIATAERWSAIGFTMIALHLHNTTYGSGAPLKRSEL